MTTKLRKIWLKYSNNEDKILKKFNNNRRKIIRNIIKNIILNKKEQLYLKITSSSYLDDISSLSNDWSIELDISNTEWKYIKEKEEIREEFKKYIDKLIDNNIDFLYEIRKDPETIFEDLKKERLLTLERNNNLNINLKKYTTGKKTTEERIEDLPFNITLEQFVEYINKTLDFLEWKMIGIKDKTIFNFIKEIDEWLSLIDFINIKSTFLEEDDIDFIIQYKLTWIMSSFFIDAYMKKYIKNNLIHIWYFIIDELKDIKKFYKDNLKILNNKKFDKEFKDFIEKEENKWYKKIIDYFDNNKKQKFYKDFNDGYYFVIKKSNTKNFVNIINTYLKGILDINIKSIEQKTIHISNKTDRKIRLKENETRWFIYYEISWLYLLWFDSVFIIK